MARVFAQEDGNLEVVPITATREKTYKDIDHKQLAKQTLELIKCIYSENGIEFEKLIKNKEYKNNILEAFKLAQ